MFLPVAPAMELEGIEQGVTGFVAQQPHTVIAPAAFDVQHHILFQFDQARMGEVERYGHPRYAVRTEPFIRQPEVRPEIKIMCL